MRQLDVLAISALLLAAACGGDKKADPMAGMPMPSATAVVNGPIEPAAGGKVVEITMTSDDKGNYFTPNDPEANPGDVLRFKLTLGVHNVNFLADSNPGKTGLPPVSGLLQLPAQTHDIAVSFAPGTYYFQCDPHAALGMRGHLKVVAK